MSASAFWFAAAAVATGNKKRPAVAPTASTSHTKAGIILGLPPFARDDCVHASRHAFVEVHEFIVPGAASKIVGDRVDARQ
jgi:hypothetical protein